jgi:methylenetetrahydrofolate--tRNA-(uracil-5-)-methyltransferase
MGIQNPVIIAGGGLAGSEAAWQLAARGVAVTLYEMRPARPTPAHKTDRLAELVCSNSLKSNAPGSAAWLLKEELRHAGSLLLRIAGECAVPGGAALAVDRERFAEGVTAAIASQPLITLRREELQQIPGERLTLIATGPLTSDAMAAELHSLAGSENLAFYDAISPVVDAETLNMERIFRASRYGKGGEDYLNCPLSEDEYRVFYEALTKAESVPAHEFENMKFFEACLPIEELARRGYDTLRFGPMKPVGLVDPRIGRQPFAVVQLRTENLRFSSYNLVGFQNHLKFPEQQRILRLIPGLENAEFLRFGQIHRNSYINAPRLLNPDLSFRGAPQTFVAGQLSGVEGYVECIATGLVAGLAVAARAEEEKAADPSPLSGQALKNRSALPMAARAQGESELRRPNAALRPITLQDPWRIGAASGQRAVRPYVPPPRTTALGSLVYYITHADSENYQPANISFDLLPMEGLPRAIARDRCARRQRQCQRALTDFEAWLSAISFEGSAEGPRTYKTGPRYTLR